MLLYLKLDITMKQKHQRVWPLKPLDSQIIFIVPFWDTRNRVTIKAQYVQISNIP